MTWIITATGAQVDLRMADSLSISILDIAHALSLINRFTGHTSRPYSVAEHSLLVVEIMQRDLAVHDPAALLAGLLHDAHEAYTSDLSTPMKEILGERWADTEAAAQGAVLQRFGATASYWKHRGTIKRADSMALAIEARDLLPAGGVDWPSLTDCPSADWIALRERAAMTWTDWRQAFLDQFSVLYALDADGAIDVTNTEAQRGERKRRTMTSGIPGTGPYARLRALRTQAAHCAYELREFKHSSRRRAALERMAADIRKQISTIRAGLKSARQEPPNVELSRPQQRGNR